MIRKPIRISGPKKVKKVVANPRVARTRNMATETQSMHMGKIRSALRQISRYWKPIVAVRKAALRGYIGKGKNRIPQYECACCGSIVDKVEIDHISPAGSLRNYADLPMFCEKLFEENPENYRAVCKPCHQEITHN